MGFPTLHELKVIILNAYNREDKDTARKVRPLHEKMSSNLIETMRFMEEMNAHSIESRVSESDRH